MPLISRKIEGCAYIPGGNVAAFSLMSMPVVVEAKKITIYNAANEADVQAILERLENIIKNSDY
jgi:hypothetical protein